MLKVLPRLILHILTPDKFTIPLINYLNREMGMYQQVFLCISKPEDEAICLLPNVFYLKNPHRKYLFSNTKIVLKYFRRASKIIIHGNPVLYYFYFFPFALKKTYWVIYGQADLGTEQSNLEPGLQNFIKRKVLKKVYGHITHIKGDAAMANAIFLSQAKLFYSPMYLTNVINTTGYNQPKEFSGVKKILMGNSTEPSNCHLETFEMLLQYKEADILIYCPLSYGPYNEYRDEVIRKGKELFQEKFIPVTDFMELEQYRMFLNTIDIAVFNHKSQTAMGVSTSLLAMGKTVFAYPETTSFHSLVDRGFRIFDINLIKEGAMLQIYDVAPNIDLIKKYYSIEGLKESYSNIYNS